MGGKAERLLALLSLLQDHHGWTGTELAERLGVSPRTIRSDIAQLREIGYHIVAVPVARTATGSGPPEGPCHSCWSQRKPPRSQSGCARASAASSEGWRRSRSEHWPSSNGCCHPAGVEIAGLATSGTEAVELVAGAEPDVVLLDHNQPDMSGVEVVRRLRQRATDVPC